MIRFERINVNLKEKIPELIKAFKHNPSINAFYLFGSYARNKIKPLSDIDIAFLLRKTTPSSKFWDIKIGLLTAASRILGTEEIDLVILNEAPFELAYNILKYGKLIFCHNEKENQQFQEQAILDYLDTQHLRDEGFSHLIERIRTGRFGHDDGRHKEDIKRVRRIFGEISAPG